MAPLISTPYQDHGEAQFDCLYDVVWQLPRLRNLTFDSWTGYCLNWAWFILKFMGYEIQV